MGIIHGQPDGHAVAGTGFQDELAADGFEAAAHIFQTVVFAAGKNLQHRSDVGGWTFPPCLDGDLKNDQAGQLWRPMLKPSSPVLAERQIQFLARALGHVKHPFDFTGQVGLAGVHPQDELFDLQAGVDALVCRT